SPDEALVPFVEDESPPAAAPGGPPGGGPPGGGPPAPPAPWPNVALNSPCSSVAWSLVNVPEETSPWIRSSIFDLKAPGAPGVPLDCEPPLRSCESMSVSAEDKADSSDELTVPAPISDCSSSCSLCRGD